MSGLMLPSVTSVWRKVTQTIGRHGGWAILSQMSISSIINLWRRITSPSIPSFSLPPWEGREIHGPLWNILWPQNISTMRMASFQRVEVLEYLETMPFKRVSPCFHCSNKIQIVQVQFTSIYGEVSEVVEIGAGAWGWGYSFGWLYRARVEVEFIGWVGRYDDERWRNYWLICWARAKLGRSWRYVNKDLLTAAHPVCSRHNEW